MLYRLKLLLKLFIPAKFQSKLKEIYHRVRYYGFRYICPFCNSHLRIFLPFGLRFPVLEQKNVIGAGYRNCLCPVCGSFDRERLVYLYLLYKTNIFQKPTKLLHVAPEKNLENIFHAKQYLDYLTADLSSGNVMVKMDIRQIQFPDNSFDVIICNHVLEHIADDRKAMRELYRVLKPDGWAILQVPVSLSLRNTYEDFSLITASDREQAFGQSDHVRIYAKDYKDRLEQVGFRVEIFQWPTEAKEWGGHKTDFGLNKYESLYIAIKT